MRVVMLEGFQGRYCIGRSGAEEAEHGGAHGGDHREVQEGGLREDTCGGRPGKKK